MNETEFRLPHVHMDHIRVVFKVVNVSMNYIVSNKLYLISYFNLRRFNREFQLHINATMEA